MSPFNTPLGPTSDAKNMEESAPLHTMHVDDEAQSRSSLEDIQHQVWRRRPSPKQRYVNYYAGFITLVLLIYVALYHTGVKVSEIGRKVKGLDLGHRSPSDDVRNSTLGFEKIFYISLPHRTDRQDAITLMTDYSGIDATYTEAVAGMDKNHSVIASTLGPAEYGCWRSHANLWQRVVREKLSTALILEDDVNWDVNLKDQLYRISKGLLEAPTLFPGNRTKDLNTPYGSDWDLFLLGYCIGFLTVPEGNNSYIPHVVVDDPWITNLDKMQSNHAYQLSLLDVREDQKHAIAAADNWACTHSYAVTAEGARRLLYKFGYNDFETPIDQEMNDATQRRDLLGMLPIPPLFSQFKTGELGADTDIQNWVTPGSNRHDDLLDKENATFAGFFELSVRKALKNWTLEM